MMSCCRDARTLARDIGTNCVNPSILKDQMNIGLWAGALQNAALIYVVLICNIMCSLNMQYNNIITQL